MLEFVKKELAQKLNTSVLDGGNPTYNKIL